MGFAFLLAFNKCFPFQQYNTYSGGDNENSSQVMLDELPWKRSPEATKRVEEWIECGGSALLEPVGDICDVQNSEALKQTALKALKDLRVWGLAGKFSRTIKNFN